MPKNEFQKFLKRRGACKQARKWVKKHNISSPEEAFEKCSKYYWLTWLLDHLKIWYTDFYVPTYELSNKEHCAKVKERVQYDVSDTIRLAYQLQLAQDKIYKMEARLVELEVYDNFD